MFKLIDRYNQTKILKILMIFVFFLIGILLWALVWFTNNYAYSNDEINTDSVSDAFYFSQDNTQTIGVDNPVEFNHEKASVKLVGTNFDTNQTTIGPEGFATKISSVITEDMSCNYISFTPKIDGSIDFYYKAYSESHDIAVKVLDDLSSTIDYVNDIRISSVDNGLEYFVFTKTLTAESTYYIVWDSSDGPSFGGLIVPSLEFKYKEKPIQDKSQTNNLSRTNNTNNFTATTIGNDGYPYVKLDSSDDEGCTIIVDVSDPLATFQWEISSDKTIWSQISEATDKQFDIDNWNYNECWFRCVVNGITVSKSVQAIFHNSNNSRWYIGNGSVYCSSYLNWTYYGETDLHAYDIVCWYKRDEMSTPYLVGSTYHDGGYYICTSQEPFPESQYPEDEYYSDVKDIKFSFNENYEHVVNVEIDFNENVKAASVLCDCDLVDDEEEYDYALVKAFLKPNKELNQIQSVGTYGTEAEDDMASFVQNFQTPVSRFWLDEYDSFQTFGYHIESDPDLRYMKTDSVKPPESSTLVDDVVVEYYCDDGGEEDYGDSGYSMSWFNMQTNTLKATSSIGRVDETGALKIEVTPASSTSIEAINDTDYYFALYDAEGRSVKGYTKYTGDKVIFNGLSPDTIYEVRASKSQSGTNFVYQDTRTYINPKYKADHETEIVINTTGNSVTISNAEPTYQYALKDANGNIVQDFISPTGDRVSFSNLEELTNYKIIANSSLNINSEELTVSTKKALRAKAISSTQIEAENISGSQFALFDSKDNVIGDYDWKTYEDNKIIFSGLTPNTRYYVKAKQGSDEASTADALTFIDPTVTVDGKPIEFTVDNNKITLTVTEPLYSYALLNSSGQAVTPYLSPLDGIVVFNDLNSGFQYSLVAASDDNSTSDNLGLATWSDFGVTANSSSKITVNNNNGFVFALYDALSNTLISNWKSYTEDDIIYEGLKPNTKYIVKEAKENDGISLCRFIRTNVDPCRKIDLSDVSIDIHEDSIELINAENQYEYILYDENMSVVSDYQSPVEGKISYNNLEKGISYILKARHVLNDNSDSVLINLRKVYRTNIVGDKGHLAFDWKYDDGITKTSGTDKEFLNQNLYEGTILSFNENIATSLFSTSFGERIYREFKASAFDGYFFNHWEIDGVEVEDGVEYIVNSDFDIDAVYSHDVVCFSIPTYTFVDSYDWIIDDNGEISKGSSSNINFEDLWVNGTLNFDDKSIYFEYLNSDTDDECSALIDIKLNSNWKLDGYKINGQIVEQLKNYEVESGTNIEIELNASELAPDNPIDIGTVTPNTWDLANIINLIFVVMGLSISLALCYLLNKVLRVHKK